MVDKSLITGGYVIVLSLSMLTDLTIWSKQIRSDQVDIEPVMFEVETITGYSDQSVDNYFWQLCFNFFFFFFQCVSIVVGIVFRLSPFWNAGYWYHCCGQNQDINKNILSLIFFRQISVNICPIILQIFLRWPIRKGNYTDRLWLETLLWCRPPSLQFTYSSSL